MTGDAACAQGSILLISDSGSHVVRMLDESGVSLGVSFGGFGLGDGRMRSPFALAARDDGEVDPSRIFDRASTR